MNFLQRIGNALSRFMYGRNGVDRLTLTMVWTALVLDIINIFLREKVPLAYSIIGTVAGIITLLALFRMFSRNLEKRRAENAKFMEKVWWPIKRRFNSGRQQRSAGCPEGKDESSSPAPAAAMRYTESHKGNKKPTPKGWAFIVVTALC